MRATAFLIFATALHAQQFEVASMKVVPPGSPFLARTADGAQIHYPSVNLLNLLREAYRLQTREQLVGPDWMRTQAYEIEAKLPANASKARIPEMLQALVAARLKLVVHHESKPLLTNVVLTGKKAPKMRSVPQADDELDLKPEVPEVHLTGKGSMAQLIDQINHGLGGPGPWVDQTGLSGFFEIKLEFALASGAAAPLTDAVTLSQALEQQLGLRVENRKIPADFVIVDHVERNPVEN